MALKKAPKKTLYCAQGKTFKLVIRFGGTNEAIDLSGYSAKMEIRSSLPTLGTSTAGDDDVLHSLSSDPGGGIIIDPLIGKISIEIEDEDTANFPVGSYFWELELETFDGKKPYFMQPSSFQVLQENTLS